jgi:hypothetical protein
MSVKKQNPNTNAAVIAYCKQIGRRLALAMLHERRTEAIATASGMSDAYLNCPAMLKNGLSPQQQPQLQDLLKAQTKPPQTLAMPFGVRLRLLFAIAFGLLMPLQSRGRPK